MSDFHVQRLRQVRDQMDAVRVSTSFILETQHEEPTVDALRSLLPGKPVPVRDIERAQNDLELTYYIRLYSEFEGILKNHLTTNHPIVRIPRDPKVDWLLSRVLNREGITLDSMLRGKIDTMRNYRNDLVHQNCPPRVVTFRAALADLNRIVAKLPDPKE